MVFGHSLHLSLVFSYSLQLYTGPWSLSTSLTLCISHWSLVTLFVSLSPSLTVPWSLSPSLTGPQSLSPSLTLSITHWSLLTLSISHWSPVTRYISHCFLVTLFVSTLVPCVHLFATVWSCLFTYVYPCLLCLPMLTNVNSCLPTAYLLLTQLTRASLPMFPKFTRVYLCLHFLTYVYTC